MSEVFGIGRQQYDHTGGEMALNPNIPSELFVIIFMGIDFKGVFGAKSVKEDLLNLIKEYVPRFEQYNPYAYALGYVMYSLILEEDGKTDKAVGTVVGILEDTKIVDYYGVPIGEMTNIVDVVRYSRFVEKLQAKRRALGGLQEMEPEARIYDDSDDEYKEYNEYADEFNDYDSDGE